MSSPRQTSDRESPAARTARAVRDRWYVIITVTVVCVVAALTVSLRSTKEYQSTAKLLFQKDGFSEVLFGSTIFNTGTDPERTAQTNVNLTKSSDIAAAVKAKLNLPDSISDLLANVDASPETNADIVDIVVTDPDPARARLIADTWAQEFVERRQQELRAKLSRAVDEANINIAELPADADADRAAAKEQVRKLSTLRAVQFADASIAETARVSSNPVSPQPEQAAAVALVLALALGVALAVLMDLFDRRIKTVEEFEQIYGGSLIGMVPESLFSQRAEDRVRQIETYRTVRNGLAVLALNDRARVLVVTSAISGEGKTTVALNLARVLAMGGERVVLVEADLRRAGQTPHLGLSDSRRGLAAALVGDVPIDDLLVPVPGPASMANLSILPSGPVVPNSGELLRTHQMNDLLAELSELADVVIVDAPPLIAVPDTLPLIGHDNVDGVLVIGRMYMTKREEARRARVLLDQHARGTRGLIVTGDVDQPIYGEVHSALDGSNGRGMRRLRAYIGAETGR